MGDRPLRTGTGRIDRIRRRWERRNQFFKATWQWDERERREFERVQLLAGYDHRLKGTSTGFPQLTQNREVRK